MSNNSLSLVVLTLALTGCAMTTPPAIVHQPMTARPEMMAAGPAANGSIYQAGVSRPMFEDRRARYVGDTITVNLVEKTLASKKSSTSTERKGSVNASIAADGILGLPFKALAGLNAQGSNTGSFAGKGDSASNNEVTGTITVTVIDVYPNGNLLVSGEKQLALNQGNEFIRFSGVVNPIHVTSANAVQSTQVADARIEYRGTGVLDETQTMGWLARFFLNVLPI